MIGRHDTETRDRLLLRRRSPGQNLIRRLVQARFRAQANHGLPCEPAALRANRGGVDHHHHDPARRAEVPGIAGRLPTPPPAWWADRSALADRPPGRSTGMASSGPAAPASFPPPARSRPRCRTAGSPVRMAGQPPDTATVLVRPTAIAAPFERQSTIARASAAALPASTPRLPSSAWSHRHGRRVRVDLPCLVPDAHLDRGVANADHAQAPIRRPCALHQSHDRLDKWRHPPRPPSPHWRAGSQPPAPRSAPSS